MANEDYCLKWNDHHSVFFSSVERLCNSETLTDVTLSCGNRQFSAHKLVLSVCSGYFATIFGSSRNPALRGLPDYRAAIVYLKDVDPRHMELLLTYMYRGEINVQENELMAFLNTAKSLQIKGLADGANNDNNSSSSNNSHHLPQQPVQQPPQPKIMLPTRPAFKPASSASASGSPSSSATKKRPMMGGVGDVSFEAKKMAMGSMGLDGGDNGAAAAASTSQMAGGGPEMSGDDSMGPGGGGGGPGGHGGDDEDDYGDDYGDDNNPEMFGDESGQGMDGGSEGGGAGDGGGGDFALGHIDPSQFGGLGGGRIGSKSRITCTVCGQELLATSLSRHMLMHTGQKPYGCSLCSYKSAEKSKVRRHMSRVHVNDPNARVVQNF